MKVLLLQDVEKLGHEGEVVTVRDGYGRNYLIPKGLAIQATPSVLKDLAERQRQQARKRARLREEADRMAAELAKTEVVIRAKVGEENRIFGTVTAAQVAEHLSRQGFEIDRRRIEMPEDIRMLGVYTARIRLHPEVTATVKIRVEPEASEG
ncbi:50S ribosomal protein L9 [Rhodothermus bifroesti]|jgi:large subunit ribosomal protein L9|uniref:Large ribosomal subunit protein bL9 n=1 Tax=Rhodothermus marinus TaxID=29549 RepID=A0A7V2AYQ6_RHOMR|nr:50S ribosomal protein L9 [Rhodothermus bifroesti]GBD00689.1 50S ribosomal protein L9 [bacterium HR18]